MIITIRNFGPVREFNIDLKDDFHLFVGKNNIGKSYAITAVYLIVKSLLEMSPAVNPFNFRHHFMFDDDLSPDESFKSIEEIIKLSKNIKPKQEVDIKSYIAKDIISFFEVTFLEQLNSSFQNTFVSLDNLINKYSEQSPTITLKQNNIEFNISINDSKFKIKEISINRDFYLRRIRQNREFNLKNNKYTIYICSDKENEFRSSYLNFIMSEFIFGFVLEFNSVINSVHYLPASRSGLYQALSAFGQIVAELSKNRSFLSKKVELPGISEPVSDYFIRLSDIRVQKKSFENKEINLVAKEIEDKILKGRVEFNSQTKQLMFYPKDTNLKLELSSTSSMVSELAPIVSYLRYVLTTNIRRVRKNSSTLIMIEEPEAHLHPEIQILLTEIFSKLIKQKVKLIITSHSNYIFNKVNNLIMSKDLPIDKVNSGVFKHTNSGSMLYKLDVNELGVEDNNFSEATSSLFDEKMDIISKINEQEFLND